MVTRGLNGNWLGSQYSMGILKTALALTASAVRHASWWVEWHARLGSAAGSRELDDAELQPCESS
jgi:hypothetical protein